MKIKQAIEVVLKEYHLSDSSIPQLIEKFFPDKQNHVENDHDELCYVDLLKQEAYDDKITFDNDDQIFHQVKDSFDEGERHSYSLGFSFNECY